MYMLEEKGFIPPEFIEAETNWFYTSLGIDGAQISVPSWPLLNVCIFWLLVAV